MQLAHGASRRLSRTVSSVAILAAVAATAVMAPPAQASNLANASAVVHGMGYQVPDLPRLGAKPLAGRVRAAEALPASVDLTANTLRPGNQGQVGSCVSWSIDYSILGYYSVVQKHPGAPFAPMFTYSLVTGGRDVGSNIGATWRIVETQGIAEHSAYPQGDYDYTTMPTAAEKANAAQHKILPHTDLFFGQNQGAAAETPIKQALAAGQPVELAIPVYQPFMSLNSTVSTMSAGMASGSVLGGHAIAIFGYNAQGVTIENSWGTSWGKSGYATLAWDFVDKYAYEASTVAGFTTSGVVPVVTGLSTSSASTAGGTSLTVTGTGFSSVDTSSTTDGTSPVRLVTTASTPADVAYLPVTARTPTTLTVTVPAAAAAIGAPSPATLAASPYRVAVINSAGASLDNGTKDDFTYTAPLGVSVTGGAQVPASSGGVLTVTGTGFGATSAAFATNKITTTVDGRPVTPTWVDDRTLKLIAPAGTPGKRLAVVVTHLGMSETADPGAVYAANLATSTAVTDPATGRTTLSVTGRGLAGSSGWTLTAPGATPTNGLPRSGSTTTALPVVNGMADLVAPKFGVLVSSDTAATVVLPAAPAGGPGLYTLSFTPSQTTYPGAVFVTTPVAGTLYQAPTVTALSLARASTGGGDRLVVSGTGLAGVDSTDPGAVQLVSVANPNVVFPVTVTARTSTSLTGTLTAVVDAQGVALPGSYRLVVRTSLGTSPVRDPGDLLTLLAPLTVTLASGPWVSAAGGVVTLAGTGFGGSAAELRTNGITATVNGAVVPVTWLSSTTVAVSLPAGVPGVHPSIVLQRNGIGATPVTGVQYVAVISGASSQVSPTAGGVQITLTGKGLAGATGWTLRTGDGPTATSTPLTVRTDQTALAGARSGVVVLNDASAVVILPPHVAGVAVITFTPDQTRYPGALYGATSRATITYSDLG